jgi:pimeloyl-ACP methyl ester carboxylesterase
MQTMIPLDGGRVYTETAGDGPAALVMPPAWGVSHELYKILLDDLELPLSLTYFDPEGTGGSTPLPAAWNCARILDEAEAVCAALFADAPVHVLGHASGGFLALAYALEFPERVNSLILVSPFAGYARVNDLSRARVESHQQWQAFSRRAQEISQVGLDAPDRFRAVFKEQRVIDMPDYGPHYFRMADAADQADFNPYMHDDSDVDLLDDVTEVEIPTLIIVGEDDPLTPLEESRLIANSLPQVRLVELPGCGHWPFVEQPEIFVSTVRRFLEDVA